MSRAHDTGVLAGLKLGIDTDASPISVLAVRRHGLVDEWNSANPGKTICVGDKITRANDFLWHLNSMKFARHMMSLYDNGRSVRPDAQGILELEIWRPHLDPQMAALLKRQLEEKVASDKAEAEESGAGAEAEGTPAAAEEEKDAGDKPEEEPAAAEEEDSGEDAGDKAKGEEDEEKDAGDKSDEAPAAAKEEEGAEEKDVGDKTDEQEKDSNKEEEDKEGNDVGDKAEEDKDYTKEEEEEEAKEEKDADDKEKHDNDVGDRAEEEKDYTKEEEAKEEKDADDKTQDAEEALVAVKEEQEAALDAVKEALVAVKEKKVLVEEEENETAAAPSAVKEEGEEEVQGASDKAEETDPGKNAEEVPATGPRAKEDLQEYRHQFFPDLDARADSQGQTQESPEAKKERNLKKKAEREEKERAKRDAASAFKKDSEALKRKAEREIRAREAREQEAREREAAWQKASKERSATKLEQGKTRSFVAALDLPKSSGGLTIAKVLGWKLDVGDDSTPVTVSKIRHEGSVAAWNAAHPGQAIRPGDQINKVNGIQWHDNSRMFSDHIAKQFAASQAVASRRLYLEVLTSKDAEDVSIDKNDEASAAGVDAEALAVKTTDSSSAGQKDQSEKEVAHSSSDASQDQTKTREASVDAEIPREGGSEKEAAHSSSEAQEGGVTEMSRTDSVETVTRTGKTTSFVTALDLPKSTGGRTIAKVLGWKLDVGDDSTPVTISKIRHEGSVAAWNAAHPGQAIRPGDRINQVNEIKWHDNSRMFADHIAKQFAASQAASRRLYVNVQRTLESDGEEDVSLKQNVTSPARVDAEAPAAKTTYSSSAGQKDQSEEDVDRSSPDAPQDQTPIKASLVEDTPSVDGSQTDVPRSSSDAPQGRNKTGEIGVDADISEGRNGTRAAQLMSAIGRIGAAQGRNKTGEIGVDANVSEGRNGTRAAQLMSAIGRIGTARSATEFSVALDVPKSLGGLSIAKILGWQLDVDGDSVPLTVRKVRRKGSVAIWNSANPIQAIRPGDKIVEVNGIPWNHNSMLFADRIAKQFEASQRLSSRRLYLKMQRAAKDAEDVSSKPGATSAALVEADVPETIRSAPSNQTKVTEAGADAEMPKEGGSQTEVARSSSDTPHGQNQTGEISATEMPRTDLVKTGKTHSFVAALDLPKSIGGRTIAKVLGWKLDVGDDSTPVTISKIRHEGSVAAWNAANPSEAIRPGDQINQVNDIKWHDNSRTFSDHIAKQFAASQAAASRRLYVNVQRTLESDDEETVSSKPGPKSAALVEADVLAAETSEGSHRMDADVNATGAAAPSSSAGQKDHNETEIADWEKMEGQAIRASMIAVEKGGPEKIPEAEVGSRAVRRKAFVQVDDSSSKRFVAALNVPKFARGLNIAKALGWKLNVKDDGTPVTIGKVRRQGSVAAWNSDNPDQPIRPGDRIIKVNGIPWKHDSSTFADHIAKQFAASQAVSSTHLYLEVQRASKDAEDVSLVDEGADVPAAAAARSSSGAREDEKANRTNSAAAAHENVFSEPGCYVRMPAGCANHPMNTGEWQLDMWAEQAEVPEVSELLCKHRKDSWDSYCGIGSTEMKFVALNRGAVRAEPVALAAHPQEVVPAEAAPSVSDSAEWSVVYKRPQQPQQPVDKAAAPSAEEAPAAPVALAAHPQEVVPAEAASDAEVKFEKYLSEVRDGTSSIAQKFEKYLSKKPTVTNKAADPPQAAPAPDDSAEWHVVYQKPQQPQQLVEKDEPVASPSSAAPARKNEFADPGCYVRMQGGCKNHPMNTGEWQLDVWSEQADEAACMQRKASWDSYCGIESTEMKFVTPNAEGRSAQVQKAVKDAEDVTSEQKDAVSLVDRSETEAARSGSGAPVEEQNKTAVETGKSDSFVVALHVPKSNGGNSIAKILGWQLDVESDSVPVTIGKIRRKGSVAAWNFHNPKHALRAGDQIVKVNGIPWNQNSKLFNDQIAKQFQASQTSQDQGTGGDRRLYVKVQRAATEDLDEDSSDQKEDVLAAETPAGSHRTDADANATADADANATRTAGLPEEPGCYVRMPAGCTNHPMNTGEWQLDVWVEKAEELVCKQRKGSWDSYCGIGSTEMRFVAPGTDRVAPPRQAVSAEATPADEVSRQLPTSSIARNFEKFLSSNKTTATNKDELAVKASGPGSAAAAAPENAYAAAVELSAGAWQPTRAQEFVVPLDVPRTPGPLAKVMGWRLTAEDNQVPPTISKIGDTGPVAQWNAAHPSEAILPGDQVVEVNGATWLNSPPPFRPLAFIDHIYKEAEAARTSVGSPAPLSIKVRRRALDAEPERPSPSAPAQGEARSSAPPEAEKETSDPEVDHIAKKLDTLFTAWNNQHPEDEISLAMLPGR